MSCFLTYIKPVIPLTNPLLEGPYGRARCLRIFNFYIFYFHFLQKYIFDMEIYRNIPRPPGCRAAGTWPPGCRAAGANLQKKKMWNCGQVLGNRPPGSRAAGLPGRPAGGRPAPHPYIRVLAAPPPHLTC